MGINKIKPNARKYSRVANNEFEFCKFTCVHLTRFDWFKNNQLLSELTHAHYREQVPLNSILVLQPLSSQENRRDKIKSKKLAKSYF